MEMKENSRCSIVFHFDVPGGLAHEFLLLRVDADHRIPRGQELRGCGVDMPELGVPIRVLRALFGLEHRLQPVPSLLEQPGHRRLTRPNNPARTVPSPTAPTTSSSTATANTDHHAWPAKPTPATLPPHQAERPQSPGAPPPVPAPAHPGRHRPGSRSPRSGPSCATHPTAGPPTRSHPARSPAPPPQQQPPLPLVQERPHHRELVSQRFLSHHTQTTTESTMELRPRNSPARPNVRCSRIRSRRHRRADEVP